MNNSDQWVFYLAYCFSEIFNIKPNKGTQPPLEYTRVRNKKSGIQGRSPNVNSHTIRNRF